VEQSTAIRIEWIGVARFDAAKTFFRKHADHAYSFTDCSNFVLMRENGFPITKRIARALSQ
jgi:predicted nucleic acid-binding protein